MSEEPIVIDSNEPERRRKRRRRVWTVIVLLFFVALGFISAWFYRSNPGLVDPQNPDALQEYIEERVGKNP